MKTLDQAWKEAAEYLQTLPDDRVPNLSIAYARDGHGGPIVTNGYCSVAMRESERCGKRGPLFWSWHSRAYPDPVEAIEHCIESIRLFVQGQPQARKDTLRGPAPLIDAPGAQAPAPVAEENDPFS